MVEVRLVSDDRLVSSSLALELGAPISDEGVWLPYRLVISAGERSAALEDRPDACGRCWLGLAPADEVGRLLGLLDDLLAGRRTVARFEPAEPNFSLEISPAPEGWTVVCLLDAGNQISDHFTWDALGVRFFTSTATLREFREALADARRQAGAPDSHPLAR